ncbi:MAG: insulinase family protein [bacterium]|nr:insulinase family protein [bacterium]
MQRSEFPRIFGTSTHYSFGLRFSAGLHRGLRLATTALVCLLFAPATVFSDPAADARDRQANLDEVFSELESRIRRVTLPNGLRVILMRQAYAPTVACYMKFKAGSADETDASSGIAHMLEHMLFKGTPRVGTRDYGREKKYLDQAVSFADKMDRWRRTLREATAAGDQEGIAAAKKKVAWYSKQLRIIQRQVRPLVIEEEDSYLYSIHGQRGYNAYTSADLTNYQIELPSNRLEVWARLESDRMRNSVLRSFYTERSVVTEERRMRVENAPRRQLFEKFVGEIYGDHPYGRPVIGPMLSIQFLNYKQAMDFYNTYYAPNNAVIALVGDIDFDESERLIRRYFGEMQRRSIPRPAEPEVERRRVRVVLREEGSPSLAMAWFKPPLPDPADLNLDLLSDVIAGGQTTRLYKRLVTEEQLAVNVGAYSGYPGERYTNLFLIEVTPRPGIDEAGVAKIESIVQAELDAIVKDGVTDAELERVRNSSRADFIYRLRANGYLADVLSYYESVTGDYKNLFEYNSRIEKITSRDIQESAGRFLKGEHRMTAVLLPPVPAENEGASQSDGENKNAAPEKDAQTSQ